MNPAKALFLGVCIGLFLVISLASISFGAMVITDAYYEYKAEGKCIAKYISTGVERKDIKTLGGYCWVVTNETN